MPPRTKSKVSARPGRTVPTAQPIVQRMPGVRVRIDPTCVEQLAAWCCVLIARYDRESRQTWRGAKGNERSRIIAQIKAARCMLKAWQHLLRSLTETVDAHQFTEALDAIRYNLQPRSGEGDQWHSAQEMPSAS